MLVVAVDVAVGLTEGFVVAMMGIEDVVDMVVGIILGATDIITEGAIVVIAVGFIVIAAVAMTEGAMVVIAVGFIVIAAV